MSDNATVSNNPLLNQNRSQEAGSRFGTTSERQVGATGESSEVRPDTAVNKELLAILLFVVVVVFASANVSQNNILAHLWVVFSSIVCPLIIMFIPGIFYSEVMKEVEDEEKKGKTLRKIKRVLAYVYLVLGALLLPLLLTLATKALFSTNKWTQDPGVKSGA